MSRPTGSTNKDPSVAPDSIEYTTEQRLEFVANLIVERIIEDQTTGNGLLLEIGGIDRGNA